MNQESKAPRKRMYLINRDFQLRYTRSAVLVGLATTVLSLALILWPLFQFRVLRFPDFLPTPFLVAIAVAAICNFGFIAWLGIFITHRIAGPMFSLVRHMRQIQGGSYFNDLKIRDSDDLKYLVRNYNELVDYLISTAKNDIERLKAVRTLMESGTAKEAVSLLSTEIDRYERRLQRQNSGQKGSGGKDD
jgi:methyl-accepting chemotaxis protein